MSVFVLVIAGAWVFAFAIVWSVIFGTYAGVGVLIGLSIGMAAVAASKVPRR